jgi:threonylcarbamoyladenosine tRNA methylthiotransferase MtaB
MENTKRAAFHNLGCKVNFYETEAMLDALKKEGYEIVPFEEQADVYIVNTCSVTNIADRKSRQMLHRAKKRNPEGVVVAVGCYVQAAGEEILKDAGVDIAIGNDQKLSLPSILKEYFAGQGECFVHNDIAAADTYEPLHIESAGEHTRAYIKVQDGCNQFCTYCIIPYTRGRIRSREMEEVLEEIRHLANKGVQEVVLTGIHLSSYGLERLRKSGDYGGQTFAVNYLLELIRAVAAVPGIARVRLGSLEPRIITEEFVGALAQIRELCPHFHLSLQSGCDSVLKRMNRHYTAKEYADKCEILRRAFKNPAITTDVIVGFPGETEEEFETTYEYLEERRLYEMHIFKYSPRKGTVAAKMPDQVSEEVKTARSARLLEMTGRLSEAYRRTLLDIPVEVLWEEELVLDGTTYMTGYTKEYVRAAIPVRGDENLQGRVLSGVLTDFLTPELLVFRACAEKDSE